MRNAVSTEKIQRRNLGDHLTPTEISSLYIVPEIKGLLSSYTWVDNFCGDGNLIFPILEQIDVGERENFFKEHIFLSDIRPEAIERSRKRATELGISDDSARANIFLHDGLKSFPGIDAKHGIYHVTNPPYLYLGYITKTPQVRHYLSYFRNDCNGLQDLYQIALYRDMQNELERMIYLIPSNFIYGNSVSNKIRKMLFSRYKLDKVIMIEKRIFEFTGTNVAICFFSKSDRNEGDMTFPFLKVPGSGEESIMTLSKDREFRAGAQFYNILAKIPKGKVTFSYYLREKDILANSGNMKAVVTDASEFTGTGYRSLEVAVDHKMFMKIHDNPLFLRTLDTGTPAGRCGLYSTSDQFGTDAIIVSGNTYRTHPIQVVFSNVDRAEQYYVMAYFNKILEYLRQVTDSDFMTTYKYSSAGYTRKYLGLNQARYLIETYPLFSDSLERTKFHNLIKSSRAEDIIEFVLNSNYE